MSEFLIFGEPLESAVAQMQTVAREADIVCLMADHHKGYNMPIGGVAAYRDKVSPAGVGFDIACGNKAVRLDVCLEDIKADLPFYAACIWDRLSFGVGLKNSDPPDHPLFDDTAWDSVSFLRDNPQLKELARQQLGTIGSGNHYVDVFCDEDDIIWVGVHFGSRGLGHKIATEYITRAGANPNGDMDLPPALLDVNSRDGQEYIQAMHLAGRYAYAGRDWVCAEVARIIGASIADEVHNHHNFAWHENHGGEDYWVVRKGATPAAPGQRGFVGSTMGESSVILKGIDSEKSRASLYSTVHGAGRAMSRTEAAGKLIRKGEDRGKRTGGKIDMPAVRQQLAEDGIILMGAGADEAPDAYKRLGDVLHHHSDTIRVLHTLRPLIVCMAGEGEFDPYKD